MKESKGNLKTLVQGLLAIGLSVGIGVLCLRGLSNYEGKRKLEDQVGETTFVPTQFTTPSVNFKGEYTTATLKGTAAINLSTLYDVGRVSTPSKPESGDLWYDQVNENTRFLVPRNNSQIGVINKQGFERNTEKELSLENITRNYLQDSVFYSSNKINVSDDSTYREVDVGSIIALKKPGKEGFDRYIVFQVVGFQPEKLKSGKTNLRYNVDLRIKHFKLEEN